MKKLISILMVCVISLPALNQVGINNELYGLNPSLQKVINQQTFKTTLEYLAFKNLVIEIKEKYPECLQAEILTTIRRIQTKYPPSKAGIKKLWKANQEMQKQRVK